MSLANQGSSPVSSDSDKATKNVNIRTLLNGAIAGTAGRIMSAPVDLLKIRFQLQQSKSKLRYRSILSAFKTVLTEEGVLAFWKGNLAGIYLYASYSAIQFGIYEKLKGKYDKTISSALASIGATLISYPFDLIRTRHSLQTSHHKYYGSVYLTTRTILKDEGIIGLFKGLGPSLTQVVPYMTLTFCSFEFIKGRLSQHLPSVGSSKTDMVAGFLSGVTSKSLTMPMDVIRKRLQIQGSNYQAYVLHDLPIYLNIKDCIQKIWKFEGIRGFFRGLSLALLKTVPATTTIFSVYGLLNRL